MKKRTILLITLIISMVLTAEDNYSLDKKTDLILGLSAVGINIPGFFLSSGPETNMTMDDINALDRYLAFYSYDETQDDISTLMAAGMLTLPIITPLLRNNEWKTWGTYGVMYAEAFLLTHGTKDLLKSIVARNRPYSYNSAIPEGEEDDYFNSFPSGHTAYAFLGATFLSTTFSNEYPDSPWKWPLIIGSYSIATGVGTMRLTSGNHFFTDVLTGASLGIFYGWGVPFLHKIIADDKIAMYIAPAPKTLSIGFYSSL